jgi:hypothetical protein
MNSLGFKKRQWNYSITIQAWRESFQNPDDPNIHPYFAIMMHVLMRACFLRRHPYLGIAKGESLIDLHLHDGDLFIGYAQSVSLPRSRFSHFSEKYASNCPNNELTQPGA